MAAMKSTRILASIGLFVLLAIATALIGSAFNKAQAQTILDLNLCFSTPQEFKSFYLAYRVTAIPVCGYTSGQMTDLIARINTGKF